MSLWNNDSYVVRLVWQCRRNSQCKAHCDTCWSWYMWNLISSFFDLYVTTVILSIWRRVSIPGDLFAAGMPQLQNRCKDTIKTASCQGVLWFSHFVDNQWNAHLNFTIGLWIVKFYKGDFAGKLWRQHRRCVLLEVPLAAIASVGRCLRPRRHTGVSRRFRSTLRVADTAFTGEIRAFLRNTASNINNSQRQL